MEVILVLVSQFFVDSLVSLSSINKFSSFIIGLGYREQEKYSIHYALYHH